MAEFINPALVPKRKLANGEQIPCIGMGTFGSDRFTPAQVSQAVAGAIRCGYRMFDCAAVYGNEDLIGDVFDAAFKEGAVTMTPSPQPDSLVLDDENLCLRVVHSPRWEVLAQELLDDLLWIVVRPGERREPIIHVVVPGPVRRRAILAGATR